MAFARDDIPCSPCGGVPVRLNLLPPPDPAIRSAVTNATLQAGAIAPGELVSIFGEHLGTPPVSSQFDGAGLYPTKLGNTTVTFNGIKGSLLYVSTTQINAMVPYGIAGQKTADIAVTHHGARPSAAFSVPVADSAPAIFTRTGTGTGQGAISNSDGTPNSLEKPAAKGSVITLFGTGAGQWTDAVQEGSTLVTATRPPAAPVSLTIGGQPARLLYAGGAPFQPSGVIQVNAVVPADAGSGSQPVVLTVGQNSNADQQVTVAVQ